MLRGSAWRATLVGGLGAVPAETAPSLQFDWLGRTFGTGYTGCDEFGFDATLEGGRMRVGDLVVNPSGCGGPGADTERAFLAAFRAVERWSVDGDRLTLDGSNGQIVFERRLPPMGDPGRELAEALRVGEWSVISATGVAGLELLPTVLFADTMFIAAGECGFTGDILFGAGGSLVISEVGWDTAGCLFAEDVRPALKQLLEAAVRGSRGADTTVVLSGARGEVVLGR